jgi:hypothetical protein
MPWASSWQHDTSPSKLILPEIPLIQHNWIWPKMASCLPSWPWWWDLVDIAQPCVDIGFFLPHKCKFLPPLGVAHCITNYSLQFSKRMAQSFLIGSIESNAYLGGHVRCWIAMTVTRVYICNHIPQVMKDDWPYWEWLHHWYKCWEFWIPTRIILLC